MRTDSLVIAMATPSTSTATPAIWLPTRREFSGRTEETVTGAVPPGRACAPGDRPGVADGPTVGNRPPAPAPGSGVFDVPGSAGSTPGASDPEPRVLLDVPDELVVDEDECDALGGAPTRNVAEAEVERFAPVAVTSSVTVSPAGAAWGTGVCEWTVVPDTAPADEACTAQVVLPLSAVVGQLPNPGDVNLGLALLVCRVILTVTVRRAPT